MHKYFQTFTGDNFNQAIWYEVRILVLIFVEREWVVGVEIKQILFYDIWLFMF